MIHREYRPLRPGMMEAGLRFIREGGSSRLLSRVHQMNSRHLYLDYSEGGKHFTIMVQYLDWYDGPEVSDPRPVGGPNVR